MIYIFLYVLNAFISIFVYIYIYINGLIDRQMISMTQVTQNNVYVRLLLRNYATILYSDVSDFCVFWEKPYVSGYITSLVTT